MCRPLQVIRDLDAEVGVLLYMLENGAPEAIVEVRYGFGGEDVAFLRVEAHPPTVLPVPRGSRGRTVG